MVGGGDGGGGVYFLFSDTDYPLLDMTVKLKLSNINHSTVGSTSFVTLE